MKAWFINLDRSADRLAHMEKALSEVGLDYSRIPAVDGRALSQEDVDSVYKPLPNCQELDRGSIGVFLSQRKAWQAIVDSGDSHGIVFEDDILFGENAAEIFSDFSWLPQTLDLLRLEIVSRHTVRDLKPIFSILDRDIVRLRHVLLGAGAYIISARAAAQLLKETRTFTYACDYVLFDPACPDYCGFEVYQMVPALCIQSAVAKRKELPSILNPIRKEKFAKGPRRLLQKIERELKKQRLLLLGLATDKIRGRKTGRIPFR